MTKPTRSIPITHRRSPAEWFADSRVVVRAKDDRARRIVLLDPARVRASSALAEPATAARLAWARAELKAGTFGLRLLLFMMSYLVLFPVLDENHAPAAVWLTALPLWGVLLWFLNRFLSRRGSPRRTHRVGSLLASHGICPTCAYSLADLTPESDGCTVCPECGGAWKRRVTAAAGPTLPDSPNSLRRGWRKHLPRGMVKDDRREMHPAWRLPPDELLNLPWSQEQRVRLTTALHDARDASRKSRRRFAVIQFGTAFVYLCLLVWISTLAVRVFSESDSTFGGGWMIALYLFTIGVLAIPLGMIALAFAQARRTLSPRAWLAFPRGFACLPRHGFCAACFNDLSNLDAELDGCSTCPECGAAWRLARPNEGLDTSHAP